MPCQTSCQVKRSYCSRQVTTSWSTQHRVKVTIWKTNSQSIVNLSSSNLRLKLWFKTLTYLLMLRFVNGWRNSQQQKAKSSWSVTGVRLSPVHLSTSSGRTTWSRIRVTIAHKTSSNSSMTMTASSKRTMQWLRSLRYSGSKTRSSKNFLVTKALKLHKWLKRQRGLDLVVKINSKKIRRCSMTILERKKSTGSII